MKKKTKKRKNIQTNRVDGVESQVAGPVHIEDQRAGGLQPGVGTVRARQLRNLRVHVLDDGARFVADAHDLRVRVVEGDHCANRARVSKRAARTGAQRVTTRERERKKERGRTNGLLLGGIEEIHLHALGVGTCHVDLVRLVDLHRRPKGGQALLGSVLKVPELPLDPHNKGKTQKDTPTSQQGKEKRDNNKKRK